ncbi:MAG: 5'/3'-nucleotidase SurE [Opitutaceae bacterium]|nr:5'/3'-nucleotidase SurE [Opitutaceae bacterium]
MRLLITNDDGINSVFLHELTRALQAAGHTLAVVAPKHEQSWIGAAKSRNRPVASVASVAHTRDFGCPTWIVDGTPSDCVNIALAHLLPAANLSTPDAVVSGINVGLNASLGFILASGTIAGAWEGALHGLPAVAFSQDLSFEAYDRLKYAGGVPDPALLAILKISGQHAARLVPLLAARTAPRRFTVHNVNFPFLCQPATKVRRTVPARVVMPGLFSPQQDDGTHRFVFQLGEDISPDAPLTDRAALAGGFISHTILDYSRLGHA